MQKPIKNIVNQRESKNQEVLKRQFIKQDFTSLLRQTWAGLVELRYYVSYEYKFI